MNSLHLYQKNNHNNKTNRIIYNDSNNSINNNNINNNNKILLDLNRIYNNLNKTSIMFFKMPIKIEINLKC